MVPAAVLTVMNTSDTGAAGDGSLRGAIAASGVGDTIVFAPGLAGQTIMLMTGELVINHDLTINGLGADLLAVSGNNASRVFNITAGTVSISGLTIEDGQTTNTQGGGAIFNAGTLTLTGDAVINSKALGGDGAGGEGGGAGLGGGIFNSGALTLQASTLSGNQAIGGKRGDGGINISGNGGNGGGPGGGAGSLYNSGQPGGDAVTPTGGTGPGANGADGLGGQGGVFNESVFNLSVFNIGSSIIADNTASNTGFQDVSGAFIADSGYNLIGNTTGASGFSVATHDITDIPAGCRPGAFRRIPLDRPARPEYERTL
jgi:hypothetical protein